MSMITVVTRNRHTSPTSARTSRLVWSTRIVGALLLLSAIVGYSQVPVEAQRGRRARLDRAVARFADSAPGGNLRVIVKYKAGAEQKIEERFTRGSRSARQHFQDLRNFVVEVDADEVNKLAADDNVESLSLDADVHSFATNATYTLRSAVGVADLANSLLNPEGAGIGIAIIDSGVADSEDFDSRLSAAYTFNNGTISASGKVDGYGHGTHVAGLVAGSGKESFRDGWTYRGLAPGARIISLKVLDNKGTGRVSDVIAALEFARANRQRLGIDIINLSLGHPVLEPSATDPLVQAVEAAVRAGIIVVCSAGNLGANPSTGHVGYAGITSPGNAPSALTVGAFDANDSLSQRDDRVADYSSRGPTWYDGLAKPDLVAPGYALVSVADKRGYLFKQYPQWRVYTGYSADYLRLSGTSMSAAVVSGAVAQILATNRAAFPRAPRLTPNAVKAILQFTALPLFDDTGARYDTLTQGAGALNLEGALRLAQAINPGRPVGSWWLTAGVTPSTTIGRRSFDWSQSVVWGNSVVWGDSVFYNRSAWASNIVWGNDVAWNGTQSSAAQSIVWGNNIVWGNSIVWGNNIVWGDSIVWGESLGAESIVWGENIVWGDRAATKR